MKNAAEIRDAASRFVRACAAERNLSSHTLRAYEADLEAFAEWCERQHISSLSDLDRTKLRRFVAGLADRRYARRTIARKTSAVRSLLRWAVVHDLIDVDP